MASLFSQIDLFVRNANEARSSRIEEQCFSIHITLLWCCHNIFCTDGVVDMRPKMLEFQGRNCRAGVFFQIFERAEGIYVLTSVLIYRCLFSPEGLKRTRIEFNEM